MSDRYFMMMGSSPRKRQVRGPERLDHHSGWLEIDSFSWVEPSGVGGGAGKPRFSQLKFSRVADAASLRLFLHCHAGEGFDLVLLDIWDDEAHRSKAKLEFLDVTILSCSQHDAWANFLLGFEDMGLIPGSGGKTAAINPAMIKVTLAAAAR